MTEHKSEYKKLTEELRSKECPICTGHGYMVNLIDIDAVTELGKYKHVGCPKCCGTGMNGV